MRWVALQPKGGTISGGIYLCNQPLKVCQKCCLIGSKLFLRNPFQDCAFTSFLWKPCFFPTWVSADILYLFLSIFNIFPEPIYHQRSYFHMFLILMCWQFNFPKKKAEREHTFHPKHFDQKRIFHGSAFYEVDIWLMRDLSRQKSHCCTFNYCKNIRMQKGLHWSQLMSKYSLEVGLESHNVGVGRLYSGWMFIPSQDTLEVMLVTQWLSNAEGF